VVFSEEKQAMKKYVVAILLSSLALPASALDKIFGNPNWSGFWNFGVGGGVTESNFLARVTGIDIDLGDDTIDDFDSPDDEIYALPVVGFRYGYTWDSGKTHMFLANDRGDSLQFERDLKLAIRRDFKTLGSVQAAFLTSSNLETEVWADPYVLGQPRTSTEQSSTGGRITWDKILGTGLEIKATYRERDLNNEISGQGQGLTFAQRQLLDRNGDIIRVEVGYLLKFGKRDRHSFRPSATYIDRNLDGAAMAQDGFSVDLSYIYSVRRLRWVNKIGFAYLSGDEENPIFLETNDANRYSLSSQVFFPRVFGWKNWMPVIAANWAYEDSDIDFNDTQTLTLGVSIFREF
jgi:hypothetical protein